jgi:activating signal cointegrator 1
MKALTIRQPWASLIAAGIKTVETRSRRTSHRGPIAIHAGMKRPEPFGQVGEWYAHDKNVPFGDVPELRRNGSVVRGKLVATRYEDGTAIPMPFGAVVAVADLVDCVPIVDSTNDAHDAPKVVRVGKLDSSYAALVDCTRLGTIIQNLGPQLPFGIYTPGRWAWLLDNIRPLETPIPMPGAQGIWNLPAHIETAVTEQLAVTA